MTYDEIEKAFWKHKLETHDAGWTGEDWLNNIITPWEVESVQHKKGIGEFHYSEYTSDYDHDKYSIRMVFKEEPYALTNGNKHRIGNKVPKKDKWIIDYAWILYDNGEFASLLKELVEFTLETKEK